MFTLTEKDIGRYVRQKSTGKIDLVSKDLGNGWVHPGVMYEWERYRSDLEFVDVTTHKAKKEGAVYDYLIWKPVHGLFYGPSCSGYTNNPELAGLYTKEFALKLEADSNGELRAYHTESQFVKKKLKDLEVGIIRSISCAIEYLPITQKIKVIFAALSKCSQRYYNVDRTYDPDAN